LGCPTQKKKWAIGPNSATGKKARFGERTRSQEGRTVKKPLPGAREEAGIRRRPRPGNWPLCQAKAGGDVPKTVFPKMDCPRRCIPKRGRPLGVGMVGRNGAVSRGAEKKGKKKKRRGVRPPRLRKKNKKERGGNQGGQCLMANSKRPPRCTRNALHTGEWT